MRHRQRPIARLDGMLEEVWRSCPMVARHELRALVYVAIAPSCPPSLPFWDTEAGVVSPRALLSWLHALPQALERTVWSHIAAVSLIMPEPLSRLEPSLKTIIRSADAMMCLNGISALIAAASCYTDADREAGARLARLLYERFGDQALTAALDAHLCYGGASSGFVDRYLRLFSMHLPTAAWRWMQQHGELLVLRHGLSSWTTMINDIVGKDMFANRLAALAQSLSSPLLRAATWLAGLSLAAHTPHRQNALSRNAFRRAQALAADLSLDKRMVLALDAHCPMSFKDRCRFVGMEVQNGITRIDQLCTSPDPYWRSHALDDQHAFILEILRRMSHGSSENAPQFIARLGKTAPRMLALVHQIIRSKPKSDDLRQRCAAICLHDETGLSLCGASGLKTDDHLEQTRAFARDIADAAMRAQLEQRIVWWHQARTMFKRTIRHVAEFVSNRLDVNAPSMLAQCTLEEISQRLIELVHTQDWHHALKHALEDLAPSCAHSTLH